MKTTGANPLLYLWEQRTLFIGKLESPLDISTGASTLMFGLERPIRFMTSEMSKPISCRSLLLPAGLPVIIDTQKGLFANCTLDPLAKDYHRLSHLMNERTSSAYYHAKDEQKYLDDFTHLCSSPLDTSEILQSTQRLLGIDKSINKANQHATDHRIETVIEIIQRTINENLSLEKLAAAANLSQSRLIEVFKRQTGMPIRRYRLWYRLYKTTESVGAGKSLTEAAVEAGFNDSSHFNKTFKSMLGMAPSCIFSQTKQLHVILPGNEMAQSTLLSVNSPLTLQK